MPDTNENIERQPAKEEGKDESTWSKIASDIALGGLAGGAAGAGAAAGIAVYKSLFGDSKSTTETLKDIEQSPTWQAIEKAMRPYVIGVGPVEPLKPEQRKELVEKLEEAASPTTAGKLLSDTADSLINLFKRLRQDLVDHSVEHPTAFALELLCPPLLIVDAELRRDKPVGR